MWRLVAGHSQEAFVLLLGGLWLRWLIRRTRQSWQLPAVITLGQLISYPLSKIIQPVFGRLRPYVAAGFEPLTAVDPAPGYSLPSNHAIATAVFLYGFYKLSRPAWTSAVLTATLLVSVSRVFAGLHYPLDIVAGWITGAGCAALAWLIEKQAYEYYLRSEVSPD